MAARQRPTENQRQHRSRSESAHVTGPAPDRFDGDDVPARVERRRLRERVRALERELAASERRRQAIVAQYERKLAERDRDRPRRDDPDRSDDGLVERLLRYLR